MFISRKIVGTISPLLGLPSNLSAFTKALALLADFNSQYLCGPDQKVHWEFPRHSYHSIARNELARLAIGEWHLQLDVDHAPAPDLAVRLVNAMRKYDADVVTALYTHRSPPYRPTLWRFNPDGTHSTWGEWMPGKAIEVDCAGAGALLVKTSVYKRIWEELGEEPFSTQEFPGVTGEDFAFFKRLKKLGIKTVCPTSVQCPHLEVRPLDVYAHYDRMSETMTPATIRTREAA